MQKRVTIITIILVSLVILGTAIGAFMIANSNYKKESTELNNKIFAVQKEVDALKESKDVNGFTPTEVVKAFFGEVKSDDAERAKLYLTSEVQDMDIKATLKLGSDLANVTTSTNNQEIAEDVAVVDMTFVFMNEETTVRTFDLAKYDGAWKIVGVTAL